jgi:hypothetical protein
MNLTTVTVTGQINKPDGTPASHAALRFALNALGIVDLSLVLPRYADAVCDVNGAFTAQVVPSPAGTYYDTTIGWSGAIPVRVRVVVPETNCNFSQILQDLPAATIDAAQRALLDLQAAQAFIATQVQDVTEKLTLVTEQAETSTLKAGEAQASATAAGSFADSSTLSALASLTHSQTSATERQYAWLARDDAEDAETVALAQAGIATDKATAANTSALAAAESALVLAEQTGIATEQAGIATTKAGEANTSAVASGLSADAALLSQSAANTSAETSGTNAGITAGHVDAALLSKNAANDSAIASANSAGSIVQDELTATEKAATATEQAGIATTKAQAADASAIASAASANQFAINFSNLATSLVRTQNIIVSTHAFA